MRERRLFEERVGVAPEEPRGTDKTSEKFAFRRGLGASRMGENPKHRETRQKGIEDPLGRAKSQG